MSSKLSPADEAFQSLMHGGSVTGLCLCAGPKVIRSRMPFSTHRIEGMARLVDEAFQQQTNKGRPIDRIWFGLGTFNLLAVTHEGMRIVILHIRDEETDFLTQVGRLFLKDYGSDFLKSPEHKRLVTARILVTAPHSDGDEGTPLPTNPATSRIPLSPRFLKLQKSIGEGEPDGSKPIVPKPIQRKIADPAVTGADPEGSPPAPSRIVAESSAPPEDAGIWPEFRQRLFQILERALGDERAQAILKEQTEEFAGDQSNDLPETWFREFGNTVVGKIEKRSLQDRARNELVAIFRELSL